MSRLTRINFFKSILNICCDGSKDRASKTCQIFVRNQSNDTSSSSDSDNEQASTRLENVDTMKCINRVTLLGRATGPAYHTTLGNVQIASFTLATNELRRNRANELIKRSDFHKVQVFIPRLVDKTKKVVQKGYEYCETLWESKKTLLKINHNSSRILVEGKINYNVRKSEQGTQHFTNITADNIVFITGVRVNQNEMDHDVEEEMEEEIPVMEKQQPH